MNAKVLLFLLTGVGAVAAGLVWYPHAFGAGGTDAADDPAGTPAPGPRSAADATNAAESPDPGVSPTETADTTRTTPAKLVKSEEEWRKILTAEQFRVAREGGTERPYGKAYDEFKKQGEGVYECVGCGAELFSSTEKFDSGCGWPSFYDPSKAKNVRSLVDVSHGMVRTEVRCARCDAHLGHVFEGEGFDTPTDKRYCINAVVMRFVPKEATTTDPKDSGEDEEAGKGAEGDADDEKSAGKSE